MVLAPICINPKEKDRSSNMNKNSEPSQENSSEQEIASLRILPEERYLNAIVDAVSDIAEICGISKKETKNLDKILVDIFENIAKYGFQGDTRKPIEVSI